MALLRTALDPGLRRGTGYGIHFCDDSEAHASHSGAIAVLGGPEHIGQMSLLGKLRTWIASAGRRRDRIPGDVQQRLPLSVIDKVTFFKRDELTADLIRCEVEANGETWFFHEEADGWDALIHYLEKLPGFHADWYEAVVQPPFATSETVAYSR